MEINHYFRIVLVLIFIPIESFSSSNPIVYKPRVPRGCYIHIPFCRRRCYYCNFPVKIIGDRFSTIKEMSESYTDLVIRDIVYTANSIQDVFTPLETLYFGGGTPSMLPPKCIARIISCVRDSFGLALNPEITIEMDPGTFDREKLSHLMDAGITRVSIGVQSFNANQLKHAGRAHTIEDIIRAMDDVYKCNMENFSIDLISSLPYSTLDIWKDTLDKANDCGAKHISIYDLQVEDKTAFGNWYTPGIFPLPTDEISADMYRLASHTLLSYNYEHYEVSNYAKTGYKSKHNQMYWNCEYMYGFGMGAADYLSGKRFTRPDKLETYIEWLNNRETQLQLQRHNHYITNEIKTETEHNNNYVLDDILEVVMLSLRTSAGLHMNNITQLYGNNITHKIYKTIDVFQQRGLVEIVNNNSLNPADNTIRLKDPDGFLFSNDIISSIFAALSN